MLSLFELKAELGQNQTSAMLANERKSCISPSMPTLQPPLTGYGNDVKTQLTFALSRLRTKLGEPQTLQALFEYLGMCDSMEEQKAELMDALKDHERVHWEPQLLLAGRPWECGTLTYNPVIPDVKDGPSLLDFLLRSEVSLGVAVKDIRDGWPDCDETLKELENNHEIFIFRNRKYNLPQRVFIDKFPHYAVQPELREKWLNTKLPDKEEIDSKLEEMGEKPSKQENEGSTTILPMLKPQRPRRRPERQTKKKNKRLLTNPHMQHLLLDYSDRRG